MDRHIPHDCTTSNVLAWTTTHSANVEPLAEEDASADVDEPPDCRSRKSASSTQFTRAPVRRGSEHHESLLTKALQSHSDNEDSALKARRRRSITSNFSLSSAGDLTCDTGFTTPARTSSPSPQLPDVGFIRITAPAGRPGLAPKPPTIKIESLAGGAQQTRDPAIQVLEKKRCISFACAAKPKTGDTALMPPPPKPSNSTLKPDDVPKKRCIQFACPSQVPPTTSSQRHDPSTGRTSPAETSPSKLRLPRSPLVRRTSRSPVPMQSKKWLTANSRDLESECARFHEFASDEPQEDDWILRDGASSKPKITINDILQKENEIRKIGKEAEEEADQEEEEDEDVEGDDVEENDEDRLDGDEDDEVEDGSDNDSENDGLDDDANENQSMYRWEDDASDGYKTDNEVGFADSDEEDDGLVLWTALGEGQRSFSGAAAVCRRPSTGHHSDSSDCSRKFAETIKAKRRERHLAVRSSTPELPDSTDFVCGTLDEDRPLEEAYISHVAARKQNKHQVIPQDIDPSFPTSEPEDEVEELYKKGYGDSDDQLWLHGELEGIHDDRDQAGRRKRSDLLSPRRMRSPPPKRRHSPPPKSRGRSPGRLFDRQSPRKLRSPHPTGTASRSPMASSCQGDGNIAFKSLAFRPGLTHTKSLPRGQMLFPHLKTPRRSRAGTTTTREVHVRGAIDIVKGLEQKRQRRKEKFYQKYCTRARKEKAQVKRPPPGQGAQRMREVGLIMAGKVGQGNFVLSI